MENLVDKDRLAPKVYLDHLDSLELKEMLARLDYLAHLDYLAQMD